MRIVFTSRCFDLFRCSNLSSDLVIKGVACESFHGGLDQSSREQALAYLKDGTTKILIATDCASRGLDIQDITHIFNYDFPRNVEEYVHRIGRTGRAGRSGESITLVTREDWKNAKELISILEKGNQEVPEELYDMAMRYAKWKERRDAENAACRPRRPPRNSGGW